MGAVGGGIWHLCKGLYNSPKGSRLRGGVDVRVLAYMLLYQSPTHILLLQAIRREAPRIGGGFAVWGGLFSMFDCTLVAVRRKVCFAENHPCISTHPTPSMCVTPLSLPTLCRRTHGTVLLRGH